MNCTEARAALLTAEPDELRGAGDTALARHLRECVSCNRIAALMLDANALLANQLTRQARETPARNATRAKPTWPLWLPLPIAAAIAALLVMQPPTDESLPRVGNLRDVKHPVEAPVVNVGASDDVAVFRAAENITVVWQLKSERGS